MTDNLAIVTLSTSKQSGCLHGTFHDGVVMSEGRPRPYELAMLHTAYRFRVSARSEGGGFYNTVVGYIVTDKFHHPICHKLDK